MATKQSLKDIYPKRYEVPLLLMASLVLLVIGLSLPLVNLQKMVFWKNTYSVFTGAFGLAEHKHYFLATVLFVFGVVFPTIKLIVLGFIWLGKLAEERRAHILFWLGILGKWSMLDVMGVALFIGIVKLKPLATVQPQIGVYVFGMAVVLSMLTTTYVEILARRAK